MSYLANEAAQSSEFEIEISGNGSPAGSGGTGQTLNFFCGYDGSNICSVTVGGAFWQLGTFFQFTLRFFISVSAAGTSGVLNVFGDGSCSWSANKTGSDGASLNGINTATGWNSTQNHTFQIYASWGNTQTGQGLTTYRTKLTRRD